MNDANDSDLKCSFAVTGDKEAFQAIFVCHCCSEQDEILCLCQACADCCHADHEDLEYIGMGPSYCDCHNMERGCQLEQISREEVDRLKISHGGILDPPNFLPVLQHGDYIRDAFTIDALKSEALCDMLRKEAMELIKHSKDTFWIDENGESSAFTNLERLAWSVFQNHVQHYNLTGNKAYGAEWWVQVKPVSLPKDAEMILESVSNGSEAVDLHYDKDEALAESFGLGSFPALSTVTYLTDSINAPPTIVFPHRYDEGDREMMADMFVSRPRKGKHVVFDGRLLHGAPSHFALRPLEAKSDEVSPQSRITFLVNIWTAHKPTGVDVLSNEIREAIQRTCSAAVTGEQFASSIASCVFESRPKTELRLTADSDLPETLRGRIELPFLGKGTTWESSDNNEGIVVVTFPPLPHESDTLLVRFGPGFQAYLDTVVDDEDAPDNSYKPELKIYV